MLCTAVDVTEKRLFEVRLASMAAQLGAAYQPLRARAGEFADHRLRAGREPPLHLHPQSAGRHPAEDYLGRPDAEIFPEADQRKLVPPKQRVLDSGGRERVEVEVEIAGTMRFFDLRLEAKTDAAGKVLGVIGTALDLTERRADEKRMRLMMRELTHRSKNLLAVIQAMARKTASLSDDIESFVEDFSARLRAMAAAHDLLVSQSWHGADLRRADPRQRLADHRAHRRAGASGRPAADAGAGHRAEPRPRVSRTRHQRQQVRGALRRCRASSR